MHNRIVNGHQTGVNEYPFVAGLLVNPNNIVFCGASILGKRWVITAAHCKESRVNNKNTVVLVGDHDLSSGKWSEIFRRYCLKITLEDSSGDRTSVKFWKFFKHLC